RKYMILAKDRTAFDMAYGPSLTVFDEFSGNIQSDGETLSLLTPGSLVVDRVRFEATKPWPLALAGNSLQLVDPTQDNSRVANWSAGSTNSFTPGAANSFSALLPPFPSLWLNEVQANNVTGPLDNFGEHDPWVELYNPGTNALSLAGYYL